MKALNTGIKLTRGISVWDRWEHTSNYAFVSSVPEPALKTLLAKSIQDHGENSYSTKFTKISVENHQFIWQGSSLEMKTNRVLSILSG